MSNHLNRKKEIGFYALPKVGTKEYDDTIERLKKITEANPENDKLIRDRFNTAMTILNAQFENGAGLPQDEEIRYFLNQFNYRTIEHGLRTMPLSFNVLEGFFNYQPAFNFFELLEEEDYLVSFFDYLDFITSPDFKEDPKLILDHFNEGFIYNYNVSNSLDKITFTTEDGDEYVIGGVSILRRENEVLVFMLTGLITDTIVETKKLTPLDIKMAPGKEDIPMPSDRKHEAVALFDDTRYWKTLVYCRIDIDKSTLDTRYVQKDYGTYHGTITDDITGFIDSSGNLNPNYQSIYEKISKEIVTYSPLFELATKCLYLPFYFNKYENDITEEEHPTKLAKAIRRKGFLKKDAPIAIPKEYQIKSKTVWCLNRNSSLKSDTIYFGENNFRIERSGYWKTLTPDVTGKDKNGNVIHGKTWVDKMLSWHESDRQTLYATFKKDTVAGVIKENPGFVYLMRNASHQNDIFKIGLTKISSKERARQLSSTTSSPDKFLVAHEWEVEDCNLAEKLIHEKLSDYRINEKREFFKLDFRIALNAITEVVDSINKEGKVK
jgi:hypothetical protein